MDTVNPAHDLHRNAARPHDLAPVDAEPGTRARSSHDLPWMPVGRDGTEAKVLRLDPTVGSSVTLLRFSAGATTGLHTHLAPATSYFLDGTLLDFQGAAGTGELGVNLAGATHDACAVRDSVLVSRLDGPVVAVPLSDELRGPDRDDDLTPVRADVLGPPDLNIAVGELPWQPTAFAGVDRRDVWQAGPNQGVCVLRLQPGAEVPRHLQLRPLDTFVLTGEVRDDEGAYVAGDYARTGAGTRRRLWSATGAELLCWADGPAVFAAVTGERLYLPRVARDRSPDGMATAVAGW